MARMPHLPTIAWDFAERMQSSTTQVVNDGTPETTYYIYDASGQRVRKVAERQAAENQTPTRMKERIYFGGFEVYREYSGNGVDASLERETLHIMDDKQRIALVETKTLDITSPLTPHPSLVRFQLGNHLGSASLEVDEAAQSISYEEYHPYGTSSYRATNSAIEVSAKRYCYSGKEKDEETGLYYHGARYYVPWLGRWQVSDPSDLSDGVNVYRFNRNNPVRFVDPNGRGALDQMKNVAYGVSGAVGSKVQSAYQGAATLASNVYNDPTGTAITMAKESLPGKIITGDFSGAFNDVWEEGAYAVGNVGNLLKSGVGLYQAEYIETLKTGSQQEIQAATEKAIDDTAGMIDTGSDIISFGTKAALKLAIKKSILGGAATAATGAIIHSSKKKGRIPDLDISDEVTERIPINDPQVVLRNLLEQDERLLQRTDYGRPPFSPDMAPEITLSGHATWDRPNEWVIIPDRTRVRIFGNIGETITDRQGRFIERGLPLTPNAIFGPGERFPNFRLTPPEGLILRGNPVYVNPQYPEGVFVSEILKPGLCTVNWAACLSRSPDR
jgi:RHS repeat-associated protein